jgi:alcohol dehydrogenase (cytochrome c)
MTRTSMLILAAAAALAAQSLTWERILHSDNEPHNWLSYSGNLMGHRYSKLAQIHTGNAGRLQPAWIYQIGSAQKFENSPIVVDGTMYISEPPGIVLAIDTKTGRSLWTFTHPLPGDLRVCCGQANRGVAVLGNLVYYGTLDARLIAIDAKTGRKVWEAVMADYRKGYSSTGAPLIVKDKVITGMAGGEYGVRGFIDAYDAASGKLAWRFWTVPAAGEPGVETWGGDSWKRGGGTTWVTGVYDPDQNLIIWGTGNPGPDWNGDVRPGDNLYTDSAVAIDADTGKLKWHFQFTPHDVHDWDAVQVPVLADGVVHGKMRKLLLWANRNAFYYVIDRTTGKFLQGRPYVRQTWAKGLDDDGRPIRVPGMVPSVEGTRVYPDVGGGTNWWSSSYSPQTNLFYVAAREGGATYFKGGAEFVEGELYFGGGSRQIPRDDRFGAIRALEPTTGKLVWEFKLARTAGGGILTTAGGLAFVGTNEGDFLALDAATGKNLWRFRTGAAVNSNPVTYMSGGKQHVAVASGKALFVFEVNQ